MRSAVPPLQRRDSAGAGAGARSTASVDAGPPPPVHAVLPISGSGLHTGMRDMILVPDRNELVFALGKHAVVQNIASQELTFFGGLMPTPLPSSTGGMAKRDRGAGSGGDYGAAPALGEITAMALCGKRQHLAICRASVHDGATVSIYSLRVAHSRASKAGTSGGGAEDCSSTRGLPRSVGHSQATSSTADSATRSNRTITTRQKTLRFDTERFSCAAMSTDGRLVCCLCVNATWTLVIWDWSRERQVAVSDVHYKVTRVRFNTVDMAQISTSGANQLKLWNLSEYTLKSFATFKSGDETRVKHVANYADHIWLPVDCLVALLEDGGVQLVINGELVQTVQALTGRAESLVALNNGEGVIVGGDDGAVALLRIVTKLMKDGEREIHLQRRMRIANTKRILGLAIDPAATMLVCCTDSMYGSYDLSNLCLLLGDDELLTLNPLATTPFTYDIHSLSAASRRPCFSALGRLPNGDVAVHAWNQLDAHECFASQVLESASPLSMDVHPSGLELVVSFHAKVVVFLVLQDSLKVAFELPAKQITQVQYSPSGSHLVAAQAGTRMLLLYRSFGRVHREPQLIGMFHGGGDDAIVQVMWSINDRSFFCATTSGEILHCRLQPNDSGDVENFVTLHSSTKPLLGGAATVVVGFACCRSQRDSHDYVIFAVERATIDSPPTGATPTSTKAAAWSQGGSSFQTKQGGVATTRRSSIRAWLNGTLTRDALLSSDSSTSGVPIPHDATSLCAGPGKMLLIGTAAGVVLMLYWRIGRLNADGHRYVHLTPVIRQVDLHVAPVSGLYYSPSTHLLLSCALSGVVLASTIKREDGDTTEIRPPLSCADTDAFADLHYAEPSQTFVCIAQIDEVGLYDRSAIELRKLKAMDVDAELQQVKLENEMLHKRFNEQRERFDEQLKAELRKHSAKAEQRDALLRSELEARQKMLQSEREASMATLSTDARLAHDQYIASSDKLQAECDRLRSQLNATVLQIEDVRLEAEERECTSRKEFEASLRTTSIAHDATCRVLNAELAATKKQLAEVLQQQDQDQMAQLALLSTSIESEKLRAVDQMGNIQGKMAALHQELKMLLAALSSKDHELQALRAKHEQSAAEIVQLKEQARREREMAERAVKDKAELVAAAHEQRLVRENLERLNSVHRSQIELLQKNLLPKDREIEQMQQHLNQLHRANQEVVVQANLSDRLRVESGQKVTQYEQDMIDARERLEHVRNSIVVLQDEMGELVRQSAVQEKSTLVTEITRIHKRLTRQLDALQARDERSEDVSAELHRQNKFLLKNKQHLRRQMELAHREKHKLVSALSFQNATLMADLNGARKLNKELERRVKRLEAGNAGEKIDGGGCNSVDRNEARGVVGVKTDMSRVGELDGRTITSAGTTATPVHPPCTSQSASTRTLLRPKSAAAGFTSASSRR